MTDKKRTTTGTAEKVPIMKTKKDDGEKTVNRLTEIDTDSVHLVFAGANGMDFAVVKSQNDPDPEGIVDVLELAGSLADAKPEDRSGIAMKMFEALAPVAGVDIVKDDDDGKGSRWMTQMRDIMGTISETLTALREAKDDNSNKDRNDPDDPDYVKVLFKTAGLTPDKIDTVLKMESTMKDRIEKLDTALESVGELAGLVKDLGTKVSGFAMRLRNMELSPVTKSGGVNDDEQDRKEEDDTDWSGDLADEAAGQK